ncbi:hypothetical protein EJB05_33681, partial [Eragrostis curvula]
AHHYDLQPTAAARTKLVKKSEDKAVNRRGTSGFAQSWTSTLQSSKVTSEADIVQLPAQKTESPFSMSQVIQVVNDIDEFSVRAFSYVALVDELCDDWIAWLEDDNASDSDREALNARFDQLWLMKDEVSAEFHAHRRNFEAVQTILADKRAAAHDEQSHRFSLSSSIWDLIQQSLKKTRSLLPSLLV